MPRSSSVLVINVVRDQILDQIVLVFILSKSEKKVLDGYIGNSDGKACERLIKFINSSVK